jgi:hypothetical protein
MLEPNAKDMIVHARQLEEEQRKTRKLLMCGQCGCPLEWCICPGEEL